MGTGHETPFWAGLGLRLSSCTTRFAACCNDLEANVTKDMVRSTEADFVGSVVRFASILLTGSSHSVATANIQDVAV